jgi:S1-C subfamily serine protease
MIRRFSLSIALLMLPAIAGHSPQAIAAGKDYRCSLDTQACLDKMVTKLVSRGWLGIEYNNVPGPDYLRVTRVVPGSPAEAAGFMADDVLISIEGAKFADNTEDHCLTCEKTKDAWLPGGTVTYVVEREGKEFSLRATLASLPSDVMAMMIGMHMLEHARP